MTALRVSTHSMLTTKPPLQMRQRRLGEAQSLCGIHGPIKSELACGSGPSTHRAQSLLLALLPDVGRVRLLRVPQAKRRGLSLCYIQCDATGGFYSGE